MPNIPQPMFRARFLVVLVPPLPGPVFRETHEPVHVAWFVRAGTSALTLPSTLPEGGAGERRRRRVRPAFRFESLWRLR